MGLLASGSHVVCHKTVYGPSRSLLENIMAKSFGVEVDFVDTCDLEVAIFLIDEQLIAPMPRIFSQSTRCTAQH
jgi:cystathionine beta-lyase/cystathionine gamma-synthase